MSCGGHGSTGGAASGDRHEPELLAGVVSHVHCRTSAPSAVEQSATSATFPVARLTTVYAPWVGRPQEGAQQGQ